MILSGKEIAKRQGKDIVITNFNKEHVNPNSYDLTLYNKLLVYNDKVLDIAKPNTTNEVHIPNSGYKLKRNTLYLARTREYTRTHNLVPMLEGKSSIARKGINIHVTAGFGDVGFQGYWTLEISCIQPVIIYPFIRIAQIYYHTIEGEYDNYNGKYQNNEDIQPSLMYREF